MQRLQVASLCCTLAVGSIAWSLDHPTSHRPYLRSSITFALEFAVEKFYPSMGGFMHACEVRRTCMVCMYTSRQVVEHVRAGPVN
jgi:hypothetical protein